MIQVTNIYGKKVFLAPSAIAEIIEAAASSQWHGIRAYIRTFDGRTIEVRESVDEIALAIQGAKP